MKKRKSLLLDCEQAAEFCEKTQYHETDLLGKLRLKLHLWFCESCRKYHAKNKKLSVLLQKADLHTCTKEEKRNLQLQLDQERSKNSPGPQ